ncbi:tRNA(Ile)(2)-agmatinylcytidine synthase [Candidatus Nitrosopelagicus sp.]|nr:tRNA(Ile)(2)-agmatinylcytidine synthase [Candidatus Nitrosopelagicus sp.]
MPKQILHIGIDDTDSPKGMCTTFLAYKIINRLKKENVDFLDFPNLVRFNPNIPWKTRGNGAVGIKISTSNPKKIKNLVKKFVKQYSDVKNGANPGLVFCQDENIPNEFLKLSSDAMWKLIHRNEAKKILSKYNFDFFYLGNGQGLVGATGVIGYNFQDETYELLSYRKSSQFGKKRILDKSKVKKMQEKTYPNTFNSFDLKKNKVLLMPHGPDPVFYGVRGENSTTLISASKMIQPKEKLAGYLIFKSNQGTGDHLKNKIDVNNFLPYTSGTLEGVVITKPIITKGGHVFFSITADNIKINCAVYKPTQITDVAKQLIVGDIINVGGGIRKATKTYPRILNLEFIQIIKLEKKSKLINPFCKNCQKHMKSKGKNQGFQCVKCKKTSACKNRQLITRSIKEQIYIPDVSAHRHLTKPVQRMKQKSKSEKFNPKSSWINNF